MITTDSLFNITEAVSFWAEYKRMSMLYPTLREKKTRVMFYDGLSPATFDQVNVHLIYVAAQIAVKKVNSCEAARSCVLPSPAFSTELPPCKLWPSAHG